MKAKERDWEASSPGLWRDMLDSDKDHVRKLDTVAWEFKEGVLSVDNRKKGKTLEPLHPNVRLILETIRQLEPKSVADFGCGFGDTLYNVGLLLPDAKLYGYDIALHGLERAYQRSPSLVGRAVLRRWDITMPKESPSVELAYTHTVIMHVAAEGHLVALRNIFGTAEKHVLLLENWLDYPFMDDIVRLQESGALHGWSTLNFYYRYSVELIRPQLMVISKEDDLPYERLYDYDAILRQPYLRARKEKRP